MRLLRPPELQDELRAALHHRVVAGIEPTGSESAGAPGVRIDLKCNTHKMGILGRTAPEHAPRLLRTCLHRVS